VLHRFSHQQQGFLQGAHLLLVDLLPSQQIANIFAFIGEIIAVNPLFDPLILLLGDGCHDASNI
jgi:hypothetical protein